MNIQGYMYLCGIHYTCCWVHVPCRLGLPYTNSK